MVSTDAVEIVELATYSRWFSHLTDRQARARIDIRLTKIKAKGRLLGDLRHLSDHVTE